MQPLRDAGNNNLKVTNMINKIAFYSLLLSVLSSNALANNQVSYKCYVELKNGENVIYSLESNIISRTQLKKEVLNNKVYSPDGISSSLIGIVYECVTKNQLFSNKQARMMDGEQPR